MKITRITATEVIVPAKLGVINSPSLHRPLHKLPTAGAPSWQRQFDELPKLLLQMEIDNGITTLGECYRDHDWNTVRTIANSLLGQSLLDFNRQQLPIALSRKQPSAPVGKQIHM